MEKYTDQRLLELIQADNHPAFNTLVNRYWEELYNYTKSRVRQDADVQDILQEIFISCWNNRKHLYAGSSGRFAGYLYQAARYAVIDHFSRPGTTIYNEDLLEALLDNQMVDESLHLKELKDHIRMEVDKLPEHLQIPYRLSREAHMSLKDIARQTALSEQTVKNNITKALKILRTRLQQNDSFAKLLIMAMMVSS